MNALSRFPVMDPNTLQKLHEARATLMGHRERAAKVVTTLDDQIRSIDQLIQSTRSLKNTANSLADLFAPAVAETDSPPLPPTQVGRYAREVLIEAGRPMKRGAILRALVAKGVPIVGGDKAKVLGTTLWRLKDANGKSMFLSTPGGYWPADVPLPEG